MSNPLPPEVQRLTRKMFAGHTGLSSAELLAFFSNQSVNVGDLRAGELRRGEILQLCLAQMSHRRALEVLGTLLNYGGRMRHGYPTHADKARLAEWLESEGWRGTGPPLMR